jgi:WD40-like Beta Propeller Repeat
MARRLVLAGLAVGTAACNQILGIPVPSRGPDARTSCIANPTFSSLAPVGGVNSPSLQERSAWLRDDELAIVFTRQVAGTEGDDDIYIAQRDDPGADFGPVTRVDELSTDADELRAVISDDGKTAYFDREVGDVYVLYSATRSGWGATFGPTAPIPGLESTSSTLEPYINHDTLYFSSTRLGLARLFGARRTETGFMPASPVMQESDRLGDEYPVVSADGLTLFFSAAKAGTSTDIWTASRPDLDHIFTDPHVVPSVSTDGTEEPQWLSPDGCRLYMVSDRNGGLDIWVATREPVAVP